MKYLPEILWLAAWPLVIWITYIISRWLIRCFEQKQAER